MNTKWEKSSTINERNKILQTRWISINTATANNASFKTLPGGSVAMVGVWLL